MRTFGRIKALQVNKQKAFRILLLVELILLVMGIVGLFGKDKTYEYYPNDTGVVFESIALPRGTYRVQMYYSTDTDKLNIMRIEATDVAEECLRINDTHLYQGWNHTDEEMWLLRDTRQLRVSANYAGEGSLEIHSLIIQQTNAMNRIYLFCLFFLITAINVIYLYREYDKAYQISVESKTTTYLLGVILLVASIPLMLDYMWSGGDLTFHLLRVEGIKDSILSGRIPNRISPMWQQGYGYAAPIFYGETMLYIAALFRLIGFSVTTSYRLFMLVITALTLLVAYFCFKKMFGHRYIGVLCAAFHTLGVYRYHKLYGFGAVGEGLGFLFLPLLVYGFWRVFSGDTKDESYKSSWLPLTLGFSLLVQSHLLSGEMAGFFTILLCVIMWKKVFRGRTFIVLAKAAVYSVLLSAWFLVPFLDYMLTGDFVIQHVSGRRIQDRGGFVAHLLFTFLENGGGIFYSETGMKSSSPAGLGIGLIVALFIFVYLLATKKAKQLPTEMRMLGVVTTGLGILAMIMSLGAFPWDEIHSWGSVAKTLVSSIQYPHRLHTIANVCLVTVIGVVAKYVWETQPRERIAVFVSGMVCCLAISNIYLIENEVDTMGGLKIYNSQGMGTGYISGAEYLPYGADASLFMPHDPVVSGEMIVEGYAKESLGAQAYVRNGGAEVESVAFALLYYKGYQAYDGYSGEKLNCYAGENFEVTVDIPAGFEGSVKVCFESPWYWRVGEMVTLVSVISMIIFFGVKRRRSEA